VDQIRKGAEERENNGRVQGNRWLPMQLEEWQRKSLWPDEKSYWRFCRWWYTPASQWESFC